MDIFKQALVYFYIFAIVYLGLSFYTTSYIVRGRYLFKSKQSKGPLIVLLLLFCMSVFYDNGDYWTYKNWYESNSDWSHIEETWRFIRKCIPWGYNWFRAFVWGGALLLFALLLKNTDVDKFICLLLFAFLYTEKFCYARASLAYMCILYAFILLCYKVPKRRTNMLRHIIAIGLVLVGLSLHRSMPILCICLLTSLLLGTNSRRYRALFFLLPVIIVVLNYYVFPSVSDYLLRDDDMEHLIEVNVFNDRRGLSEFLTILFSHSPILLLFFVSFYKFGKNYNVGIKSLSYRIANAAFTIIYFAVILLFINVGNGLILFYRTLIMAYPFMLITITYALKRRYINKYVIGIALLCQWYYIYQFLVYIIIHPEYLQNQILERLYYGL